MSEIEKLNMIAEWQEQYKQLIEDLDNSKRRISDLEKENAELKKQLGMSNKVYNDNLDYSHHIEDQLTKAKEIIKKLIEAIHIWDCKNLEEVEAEAEHFFKDCEVEK